MVRLDLKQRFWSLAVHKLQKQHPLMTNFATKNEKIKSSINENFTAKKMKISKFWGKYMICISKQSKQHVEFRFRLKKCDFEKKNNFFFTFSGFFSWSHRVKFLFFNFSRFQKKIFFEMASMGPLECWKKQSHEKRAHLGHPLRSHARSSICACGFHPPPHVV